MCDCKPCSMPVDAQAKLSEDDGPPVADVTSYRNLIGALQYITFSRPDIAYTVQQVFLHMHALWEPCLTQADPALPPRLPRLLPPSTILDIGACDLHRR